jgi:16S rRNA (cytosine1402-N4)-methyltransferase
VHKPVLARNVIRLFEPALKHSNNPILLDCTLGLAGHTRLLLERFPKLRVIALDRDESAIRVAKENLGDLIERVSIHQVKFDEYKRVLAEEGVEKVDAVFFDLGLSSMQIDDDDRGFSYIKNVKLDMRMNPDDELDAKYVLNNYEKDKLVCIFRLYGEEKFARQIADGIVEFRERQQIATSDQLRSIVKNSLPAALKFNDLSVQKRIFQSLRIEVNDELNILKTALTGIIDYVKVGGRIVAMSYHSLEDRIVKRNFKSLTEDKTPIGLPVKLPEFAPYAINLTPNVLIAGDAEKKSNPRSKSVKLRAIERVR